MLRLELCILICRNAVYYLIFELVSQRFLAAGTINKSVRIPCSVAKVIGMVIEFVIAVLASAMKCRVVHFVSGYRIGINDT